MKIAASKLIYSTIVLSGLFLIFSAGPRLAEAMPLKTARVPGEMLLNPDFSDGLKNWVVEQTGTAAGRADRVAGPDKKSALRLKVLEVAPEPWRLQLYQKGLTVKKGANYVLTFRVKVKVPGGIMVNCMQNHEPWDHSTQKKIQVFTQWTQEKLEFVAPWDDDNVRITFTDLATVKGQVYWFADCSLVPEGATRIDQVRGQARSASEKLIVWDGESAKTGAGWVTNVTTCAIMTQSVESHSFPMALEFKFKGSGEWLGAGWNWCAFKPMPCGTDIAGFQYFTFWIKKKGQVADFQFNILCNGPVWDSQEHHTVKVSVQKYCPQFVDGQWHKVRVPLADLSRPEGFDNLHVGEIQMFNTGAGDGSFFLDDIGFENTSGD